MNTPDATYTSHIAQQKNALEKLLKKRSALGWIRFGVFAATVIATYIVFSNSGLWGLLPLLGGIGFLLLLVSYDVNNNTLIRHTRLLISMNEEELQILSHRFQQRDDGSDLAPQQHHYSNDLDLFGPSSLFQWMNRCYADGGRSLLAGNLLAPLELSAILERQEAVKELSPLVAWRQELQAYAAQAPIRATTTSRIKVWLREDEKHFTGTAWRAVVIIYPVITLGSAAAAILGYLPAAIFSFLYVIFLTVSILLSGKTIKPYLQLSGIVKEMVTMEKLIAWIGNRSFQAALLQGLQTRAELNKKDPAEQIKNLRAILDRFDLRLNIAGLLFFNAFLLWDVRQMMSLNDWRKKNKAVVPHWFNLIAEFEVLHSISTLHFNHPDWCFPQFSNKHLTFNSVALGHPLIPSSLRVVSDFKLEGSPKIGLVTGSNMAGKSTFLRSLGVNSVLAQAGAPVCAGALTLSPFHLMSSMRIADNLAENTSTFYAELKKLKTIIEAVNRHEKIFILLDEILRGTNSLDRHTGSAALIRQLISQKAAAVIATHDVELAALEDSFPTALENYHFDVQVEGEELYFDYKLKHGVCTSLNASILMKKIGIELQ